MKKIIVCDYGEWTRKLITLSRFANIEYFVDDKLNNDKNSENREKTVKSCGVEKKIFPIEKLLEENPDKIVIIVGDNKLYPYYKEKLELLGFKENFNFFNGWDLNSEFYRSFFEGKTWEAIERNHENIFIEEKSYEYRAKAIAELIPKDVKSIMDLGCGNEALKKYVKGIKYIGVDYKKRSEDTLVCDLEKDFLPNIPVDMYCLIGVIYYLNNIKDLIIQLRKAKYVLLSYRGMEHYRRLDNRFDGVYSGGLENSLYTADLVNMFFEINFVLVKWERGYLIDKGKCNEDIFLFKKLKSVL